jgi:hypothetical protein
VVLLVGVVVAVIVPVAGAATGDIAASTRYVAAASSLFKATIAANKQEKDSADAVAEDVSAHCRGALPGYLRTGTPAQQRIWTALANDETGGELLLALVRPVRKAYAAAARKLEDLRWTRPAINRAVAAEAHRTLAALALKAPDQCADVRAAAATQFTTVPTDAKRFIARATRLFLASDAAPAFSGSLKLLKSSIPIGEGPEIRTFRSLEAKLNRVLTSFYLNDYLHVVDALRGM